MSQKLNCKPVSLETDEFADMPDSWCDNILPKKHPIKGTITDKNDWQSVFVDFLREDILIETCRFFKLRTILELCEGVNEIQFVTRKFKKEVLDEVDFEQIYRGIIKSLPGEKWQEEHTNQYLEESMQDWTEVWEKYKQVIAKFRIAESKVQSKNKASVKEIESRKRATKVQP